MIKFPIALSSILLISTAHAAEPRQVNFSRSDWEIVCDNTGTCRQPVTSLKSRTTSTTIWVRASC
jgi:hypothetical protein